MKKLLDLSGLNKKGLVYLLVVYIIWGSTYLAIRIAVREGSGLTPFFLGATRGLIAGLILLLWGWFTAERLKPTRREVVTLVGSGLLLWLSGNGLLMVAEQRADSGPAALVAASVPIWVAVIEAVLDRRKPSHRLVLALTISSSGILVLSMPTLLSGVRADIVSVLILVIGSISWAAGFVLQSRRKVQLAPVVSSGFQLLVGGISFLLFALLFREPFPHPNTAAWLALSYLTLFGSLVGFTAFTQILRLLPADVASTYGYVNPILAVLLGWIILGEKITIWTVVGTVLVIWGVSRVFKSHGELPPGETSPAAKGNLPVQKSVDHS